MLVLGDNEPELHVTTSPPLYVHKLLLSLATAVQRALKTVFDKVCKLGVYVYL